MNTLASTIVLSLLGGLALSEFETLQQRLQPSGGEAWRTIPWKTSLIEAQAEAARRGKPLFIWAMDGHPLGCV
jgi:hypothetical protein